MHSRAGLSAFIVLLASPALLCAADWPQWRGPTRDGAAPDSPPLLESFPETGPKQLWTSEELPDGDTGGWGSPVAARGKVYQYVSHNLPVKWRLLTKAALANVYGYNPEMPGALSQAVEAARVSPERAQIVEKLKIEDGWLDPHDGSGYYLQQVDAWAGAWIKAHTKPEDEKFLNTVRARLKAGPLGPSLELLAALAPIADQRFNTPEELDRWGRRTG